MAYFYIPFVMIVIVGSANAVNLTDGLDGLAIMPVMIAAGTLGVIAYAVGRVDFTEYLDVHYVPGTGELLIFAAGLIGGGLGFLWYNAPPAAVFMGDTGSLALGGALGTIAVVTKHELVWAVIGGLFVVEALSRHHPGPVLQVDGQAGVPDGPDPPPFREEGLGRAAGRHPVLDHRADPRADRAGDVEGAMMTDACCDTRAGEARNAAGAVHAGGAVRGAGRAGRAAEFCAVPVGAGLPRRRWPRSCRLRAGDADALRRRVRTRTVALRNGRKATMIPVRRVRGRDGRGAGPGAIRPDGGAEACGRVARRSIVWDDGAKGRAAAEAEGFVLRDLTQAGRAGRGDHADHLARHPASLSRAAPGDPGRLGRGRGGGQRHRAVLPLAGSSGRRAPSASPGRTASPRRPPCCTTS